MRIISKKAIREFGKEHSDAVASLATWAKIVEESDWKTPVHVLATLRDADLVGDKVVFNIAQNRYRLIAWIAYRPHIVYIKAILTHEQYDKENWKE